MKKLLSLLVVAASLTLFSCENNTVNEHEGTDVDTVTNTEINNTEINTNTNIIDTTNAGMGTDTTNRMGR